MENTNRTLSHVLSQGSQTSQNSSYEPVTGLQNTQSFNTFLTIYSVNLSHRFPDVTDLSSIDYSQVRKVADFSMACSIIALEAWEESGIVQPSGRRLRPTSSRSA